MRSSPASRDELLMYAPRLDVFLGKASCGLSFGRQLTWYQTEGRHVVVGVGWVFRVRACVVHGARMARVHGSPAEHSDTPRQGHSYR